MRLNKEQEQFYKEYILNCISNEGYSEKELKTDKEKIAFLHERFMSESGFKSCEYIKRKGILTAFKDWISGLPSSFNIAYSNHDILKLAVESGTLSKEATENEQYKILNNYFNFIANKTLKLMKKEGVLNG